MNTLRQFQDTIKTVIQAISGLNGVTVLVEDSKALQSEIDKALARIGLAVIIGNPSFAALTDDDGRQTPVLMSAEVDINIGEAPTIWRSVNGRPTCMDVAEKVSQSLHGYDDESLPFEALKVVSVVNTPADDRQVYTVTVRTKFQLPDPS